MSKRQVVDFVSAMQNFENKEGVQRHRRPADTPSVAQPQTAPMSPVARPIQRSRIGKVSIGVWVDPVVRKQLAQLALDTDRDQADLIAEALNLLFERYGKSTIAGT